MVNYKALSIGGVALAALEGALAQTAPGFPVQVDTMLMVSYGDNEVSPPGEQIPRGETANAPTVSSPVWRADERDSVPAVLMMVDSDVPRNGGRVQLLHWLVTDVTQGGEDDFEGMLNIPTSNSSVVAEYLQPSPPVGDTPHAYSFVVFPQPANFTIPSQFNEAISNRVGFNTSAFVEAAGLVNPIAGNYIRVQNLTGTPTQTFPPPRPTNNTMPGNNTDEEPGMFDGAAAPSLLSDKGLWAGLSTAVLAGVAAWAL